MSFHILRSAENRLHTKWVLEKLLTIQKAQSQPENSTSFVFVLAVLELSTLDEIRISKSGPAAMKIIFLTENPDLTVGMRMLSLIMSITVPAFPRMVSIGLIIAHRRENVTWSIFSPSYQGRETMDIMHQILEECDDVLFGNFIAYMFIDACGPTSCAMFEIWNNKKSEKRIGLIDVYTFQPFRNRGYATKILEYATEDLNIDRSSFSYLGPACDTMNHIFDKLGVNPIAFCKK